MFYFETWSNSFCQKLLYYHGSSNIESKRPSSTIIDVLRYHEQKWITIVENSQFLQQSFTSCRDYSFRLLLFFYFRCLRPFRAYDATCNIKFLRRSYLTRGEGGKFDAPVRLLIQRVSIEWAIRFRVYERETRPRCTPWTNVRALSPSLGLYILYDTWRPDRSLKRYRYISIPRH